MVEGPAITTLADIESLAIAGIDESVGVVADL